MPEVESTNDVAALTVQLLSAYLANNTVASEDLAGLIRTTRNALNGEPENPEPEPETFTPAVSVRKSLASPERIISLIDGKPYKTLKRHLASHGLTPDAYRTRYNLAANYPMVAPDYAEHRRAVAQRIGLGSRRTAEEAPLASASEPVPAAVANVRADAPNSSGDQSSQADAAPEKLSRSSPTKRAAKSSGTKAARKAPGKSKVEAQPVEASAPAGKAAPAPSVPADDQNTGAPAQKPKRRARLGMFKNSDVKPDVVEQAGDDGAVAAKQLEERATAAPAAKVRAPAKSKRRPRKARAADVPADEQPDSLAAGQDSSSE